jgi:hypothetical protein
MLLQWKQLKRWIAAKARRNHRVWPEFELLEDRTVPSTFTVNTTNDTQATNLSAGTDLYGSISLRSALEAANSNGQTNIIILPAGNYTLTIAGGLTITSNVTIEGGGSSSTIINANGASLSQNAPQINRAFQITSGTVELENLTVENGLVTGAGGGIANYGSGTLTLQDCVVSGNEAEGGQGSNNLRAANPGGAVNGFGGGIYNAGGTLDIIQSTISGNTAQGGEGGEDSSYGSGGGGGGMGAGGGVFDGGGNVEIQYSTISGNNAIGGNGGLAGGGFSGYGQGGGGRGGAGGAGGEGAGAGGSGYFGGGGGGGGSSYSATGGLGGTGGFGGGGGGAGSGGESGGAAGFGAGAGGSAGDTGGGGGGGGLGAGGGLFLENGTAELVDSTLTGNTATGGTGGQVFNYSGGVAGNGGQAMGGGFFVGTGSASAVNVTIANNSVAGGLGGTVLYNGQGATAGTVGTSAGLEAVNNNGSFEIKNTIVSSNQGATAVSAAGGDITGVIISDGYNLIQYPGTATFVGPQTDDILNTDPGLYSLANNGGPTETLAIGSSSAAVNAGSASGAPTVDQRGVPDGGTPDIGAFEYNPFAVTNTNATGTGSLAQAIDNNNSTSGGNTITFEIGDSGSTQIIEPLYADGGGLPVITEPVTIDGWSQGGPGYTGPPLIEIDGQFATDFEVETYGTFGLNIQASNVTVRGLAIDDFAEGPIGNGFGIGVFDGSNIWIYGNYIGVEPDGLTAAGNGQGGIWVGPNPTGVLIGTNNDGVNDAQEANVISGNGGNGILLQNSGDQVFGNLIGVGAESSTPLGNGGSGIYSQVASDNAIGGIGGALPNIIANNGGDGVTVYLGNENNIRGNEMAANGGLGIDLAGEGANEGQSAPTLSSAILNGSTTAITLTVPSTAAGPVTIDFYEADSTGEEGEIWLGSTTYTAAQAGNQVTYDLTPAVALAGNDLVVATATDADGNTSEFSANVVVDVSPVLVIPGPGATFSPGAAPVLVTSNGYIEDTLHTSYVGGNLTVSITAGDNVLDTLGILNQGSGEDQINVVGSSLFYSGSQFGTFSGGTGGTPLVISLTDAASPSVTQALLEDIAFSTTSTSDPSRTVTFTLDDGEGGTSGPVTATVYDPFVVTTTADSGPGSLRQAILSNNATSGGNTITFDIGSIGSSQTIEPLYQGGGISLPTITEPVTIDGWSQGGPGYTGPPLIELDGVLATNSAIDGAGSYGLIIFASNVTVRGLTIDNYSGGESNGIGIGVFGGSNIWIYGNYIGVGPDGVTPEPNDLADIWVGENATDVLIGTNNDGVNDAQEANVISGNTGAGIVLQTGGNYVFGNLIGVGADGVTDDGNGGDGIQISGNGGNEIIGGVSGALPNVIENNGGDGVSVQAGTGNTIRGNEMAYNGGLGIDLVGEGPNNNQSAPTVASAVLSGSTTTITYTIPANQGNTAYPLTIDFYEADYYGEDGEVWLGSTTNTAAQAGTQVSYVLNPAVRLAANEPIVATATDANGNTSEFSNAVVVDVPPTLSITGPAAIFISGTQPVLVAPNASIEDNQHYSYSGGTLTVSITSGGSTQDVLGIVNQGTGLNQISVVGNSLYYGEAEESLTGVYEAFMGQFSGGTNGNPLTISLSGSATQSVTEALLQDITFSTTSTSLTPRIVTFTLNDGAGGTSAPVTAEVLNNAYPTLVAGPQSFIGVTTPFVGNGSFSDLTTVGLSLTVNYGDGTAANPDIQAVPFNSNGTFSLFHVYAQEGSYFVTVTLRDALDRTAISSFYVNVFVAGPITPGPVVAAPGTTTQATIGNVSVSLTRSSSSRTDGLLVVAQLPTNAVPANLNSPLIGIAVGGGKNSEVISTFDIRAVNLTPEDSATVTFYVYSPDDVPPEIVIVNAKTGAVSEVVGSTKVPNSPTIVQDLSQPNVFLITVVFDDTSKPPLYLMSGTIFSFVVPDPTPVSVTQTQGPFTLASNGDDAMQLGSANFEISFDRSGPSSGSQITIAIAPAQARQIEVGEGQPVSTTDSGFVQDMMMNALQAYWQTVGGESPEPELEDSILGPMLSAVVSPDAPGGAWRAEAETAELSVSSAAAWDGEIAADPAGLGAEVTDQKVVEKQPVAARSFTAAAGAVVVWLTSRDLNPRKSKSRVRRARRQGWKPPR